jgi:imidazolonepropionase
MPLMMALACIKMKLTPEEAINAATINTACALELQHSYGSIGIGRAANVFITRPMPSLAFMPYAFGSNLVEIAILAGKKAHF